ncbi:MAG: hypothetical protein ACFFC7_18945 [Candidatus Hermodarchaeota archaeon]
MIEELKNLVNRNETLEELEGVLEIDQMDFSTYMEDLFWEYERVRW